MRLTWTVDNIISAWTSFPLLVPVSLHSAEMFQKVGLLLLLCIVRSVSSQAEEPQQLSVLMVTLPLTGHLTVHVALGEELVRRGHSVTMFVAAPEEYSGLREQVEKGGIQYRTAPVRTTREEFVAILENHVNNTRGLMGTLASVSRLMAFIQEILEVTYSVLAKSEPNQWDLVLADEGTLSVTSCLSNIWRVPVIVLSSNLQFTPNNLPPWPFPTLHSNNLTDNLDFRGRFLVTFNAVLTRLMYTTFVYATSYKAIECPTTTTEIVSMSGVRVPYIVPSVIGFEYPRPISPLTTYVGPILSPVTDPLPENIQMWLDSCPTGSVVYISMGSAAILTHQAARAIVEGLNATGYSAVWSLRKKNRAILHGLEVSDKKILLLDWAPQLAILRHRSIRMAILHGGMNGVNEALHSGVPIIVLPSFADQPANADRVAHHGLGIRLDPNDLTSVQIIDSIHRIDSGDYHILVNKLRKIFDHAGGVMKAADLVELYAEVGYDHLIPAYARYGWTWIQYYNVDVCGLLLVIGGMAVFGTFRLCRCCLTWWCRCTGSKVKVE